MSVDLPPTDLKIPIALRKGTCATTAHPISNFVTYDKLHPVFRAFALPISFESLPRNYQKALSLPHWKVDMDEEMQVLMSCGTWDLVPRPTVTNIVTSRWLFTIKYKPNDMVDRYKARLVACGFTQEYGVDYAETFAPVARLNSIRVIFSITINQS